MKRLIMKMIRKQLHAYGAQYDYDCSYMADIADTSLSALLKLALFQGMTNHRKQVPLTPYFAVKLRAALHEDCGPCVQLVTNMAAQAGLENATIQAILEGNMGALDHETRLACTFCEQVIARDPEADNSRAQVYQLWGNDGVISLSYAICSARLYPSMKYALGHGQSCQRVHIEETSIHPQALQFDTAI